LLSSKGIYKSPEHLKARLTGGKAGSNSPYTGHSRDLTTDLSPISLGSGQDSGCFEDVQDFDLELAQQKESDQGLTGLQLPAPAISEPDRWQQPVCDRFIPIRCENSGRLFELKEAILASSAIKLDIKDTDKIDIGSELSEEPGITEKAQKDLYQCLLQAEYLGVKDPHTMPGNQVQRQDLDEFQTPRKKCLRLNAENKIIPTSKNESDVSFFRPKKECDIF
jgi:hypothetical protein